ncbi:MAG: argininosuccinate lyase [Acidobacteriota bacterium]
MSRLWDRGAAVDERILRFTTGRDPELDQRLLPYDALASAAHAMMLKDLEVLNGEELEGVLRELAVAAHEARAGDFTIHREQEDGHTALENRLTERLGEAGRKIHTGRSRNDQVLAALRLWGRDALLEVVEGTLSCAESLLQLAQQHRETSLPGYTHMRQAMPSTLGLFFSSYASCLLDGLPWLDAAYGHLDRSPLGAASGFGVALPLRRDDVAQRLAFSQLQANTLAVQSDRGKTEWLVLGAALAVLNDAGRLAMDLIWYSTEELGYISLADEVTTGSSIMPQKRNPDVLELVRASAAKLRGRHGEIASIYAPLGAGYHRDLQHTKEPFLEGLTLAADALFSLQAALGSLSVDEERCRQAMTRAIGATDAVYRRVAAGEPFRAAYREVAIAPEAAVDEDPTQSWRARHHAGAPALLDLDPDRQRLEQGRELVHQRRQRHQEAWSLLPEVA